MNKHFEDAKYYVNRATEHAKAGVAEELEPVESKVRELTGREEEPEPTRLERIQHQLETVEERAEGEAKQAVAKARERIERYRAGEPAEPDEE